VDGKSMYDQEFSPYQGTYSSNTVRHLAYVLLRFITSFTSFYRKVEPCEVQTIHHLNKTQNGDTTGKETCILNVE
jgi:hypothetical protein